MSNLQSSQKNTKTFEKAQKEKKKKWQKKKRDKKDFIPATRVNGTKVSGGKICKQKNFSQITYYNCDKKRYYLTKCMDHSKNSSKN